MARPGGVVSILPISEPVNNLTARRESKTEVGVYSKEYEGSLISPHSARHQYRSKTSKPTRYDANGNPLTRVGRAYTSILRWPVLFRYVLYAFPLGVLLAIPIIVGNVVGSDASIGRVPVDLFFGWIEVLWISFWVTRLFVYCAARIVKKICGAISAGLKKYADTLCALERPLTLTGWLLICYLTFFPVISGDVHHNIHHDEDSDMWTRVIHRILGASFSCSLIFLGEKALVQFISVDYHRKQFEAKIRDSKAQVELLGKLYAVSRKRNPEFHGDFVEYDDKIQSSTCPIGATISLFQHITHTKSKSASTFNTSAFDNIAREHATKKATNDDWAHTVVTQALEHKDSTDALACRLWASFALPGQTALTLANLAEALGGHHYTLAEDAFELIDRDGNGDITFDELKITIAQWAQDRQSINKSIHDVDHAVSALDGMLVVVVFVLSIVVFVAFLDPGFYDGLSKYYAGLMSASWLFAGTVQEILGSCIFLFVKHPYDILDRVDIDKEALVVEQISLLFTVFRRASDRKTIQIPHVTLNAAAVHNVSRSPPMRDVLKFEIAADTPPEDVALLKAELEAFVRDPAHARDFQPDVGVEATLAPTLAVLDLAIDVGHRANLANSPLAAARRRAFGDALLGAVRRIPINGAGGGSAALGDIGKPTYTVAVSPAESLAQRERFAAERDAKRQVPKQAPAPQPGAGASAGVSTGVSLSP